MKTLFSRNFSRASTLWNMLRETFSEWSRDGASRLAAALAYYTIFSLAPLLIIVIAVARALSPGVNDPFTAVTCLDQAERAFGKMSRRRFPSAERFDEDKRLRVITDPVTFDHLLRRTFDPIRQYGCGQALVSRRLLEVLGTIASHART